jgi:hypothetical protein
MWDLKPTVLPWIHSRPVTPNHYEDSRFVSLEFAKELVEMYYRRCTFIVGSESLHILDTFLQQDPFGYDVVVSRNLCRLEILLLFHDGRGPTMKLVPGTGYVIDVKNAKRLAMGRQKVIAEKLAPLAQIKRRCHVKITFDVWSEPIGLVQFQQTVAALMPLTVILEDNGCNVDVQVNQYYLRSSGMAHWIGFWILKTADAQLSNAAAVSPFVILDNIS